MPQAASGQGWESFNECKWKSILEDALPTRELCFGYGDDLMFLPICINALNEIIIFNETVI